MTDAADIVQIGLRSVTMAAADLDDDRDRQVFHFLADALAGHLAVLQAEAAQVRAFLDPLVAEEDERRARDEAPDAAAQAATWGRIAAHAEEARARFAAEAEAEANQARPT